MKAYRSIWVHSCLFWVRVAQLSVFRVLFCRSFCLVVLFLLSLYCLSFFDLQLLRNPLVFSNCSYVCSTRKYQMASRGTCNFYVSWYFDLSIFSVTYAVYYRNVSFHPGFYWGSCYLIFSLCVGFVDRCLSFCTFSFGHCVVCSSSIFGFWLLLWYFQTLLDIYGFIFDYQFCFQI